MQTWTTSAIVVDKGSGGPKGILSWFIYRDGGETGVFHKALNEALKLSGLTATRIREGDYPFFTIVEPIDRTVEAMERFASSLYGLPIVGSYCNRNEQRLLKRLPRARVIEIARGSGDASFKLCAERPFSRSVGNRCAGIAVEINGHEAFVQAEAANDSEIARRIRLAANVFHVRLDPQDELTKQWVGEPLV